MNLLVSPEFRTGSPTICYPISFGLTVIKRVCRSTMQADTYSLQAGVESADVIRAAVAHARDQLDLKGWENSAASQIPAVWITDCKSSESALNRPTIANTTDKRLGIGIASLRQSLWRERYSGEDGDPAGSDETPDSDVATGLVRWIDTDCMIADPLTKQMDPEQLIEAPDQGFGDITQPMSSIQKKENQTTPKKKNKGSGPRSRGRRKRPRTPSAFRSEHRTIGKGAGTGTFLYRSITLDRS